MASSGDLLFFLLLHLFHPLVWLHPLHHVTEAPQPIEILMPGVAPQVESNLCRSLKLNRTANIIGFEPKAKMPMVHHILLYGCGKAGSDEEAWLCQEMAGHHHHHQHDAEQTFTYDPVCAPGTEVIILYAWARDAPKLMLPPDVGLMVGPDSKIKYIVLQVHYADVSSFQPPNNNKDHSGIVLLTKGTQQPKQAGIYLILAGGRIPPHATTYVESACEFNDLVIHPFAFRTHTHDNGQVVSGYRVRGKEWTEIGRKDPKLPQMFYNITKPEMTIEPGDILAARCTFVNKGDELIEIGSTSRDEMCNFYIMFYVEGNASLKKDSCYSDGPPAFKWKYFFKPEVMHEAPRDASIVPGTDKMLIENESDIFKDLNNFQLFEDKNLEAYDEYRDTNADGEHVESKRANYPDLKLIHNNYEEDELQDNYDYPKISRNVDGRYRYGDERYRYGDEKLIDMLSEMSNNY